MLIGLGAGLGVGGLKYALVDHPQDVRDRNLAAATQRYSPWTHLQAQPLRPHNLLGNMMETGATGAMMGQNVGAAQQKMGQNAAMTNWLNGGMDSSSMQNSPWSIPQQNPPMAGWGQYQMNPMGYPTQA
jgi:hypothetical protein